MNHSCLKEIQELEDAVEILGSVKAVALAIGLKDTSGSYIRCVLKGTKNLPSSWMPKIKAWSKTRGEELLKFSVTKTKIKGA